MKLTAEESRKNIQLLTGEINRLEREIVRLKQPGPCGKHPAACLEVRIDKVAQTLDGNLIKAKVCSACESERAAVKRKLEEAANMLYERTLDCGCDMAIRDLSEK